MNIEFYSFIIFILYFFYTFFDLYKKDILFATFYAGLFIYTIFSQIGYVYLPFLSELRNANYGMDVFWVYYKFVFLSFISIYIMLRIILKITNLKKPLYRVSFKNNNNKFIVFTFIIGLFLSVFFISIFLYGGSIQYGQENMGIVSFMYKRNALIAYVLYVIYRQYKNTKISYIYLFFFIISVSLEMSISTKIGSRQDIVALILAISAYELYLGQLNNRTRSILKKLLLFFIFVILLLGYIRENRGVHSSKESSGIIENVVNQDYFSPSYMLFTAINYNYVKTDLVIKSNTANSLVKLNVPYLQEELGNIMVPGSSSRQSSFAFYAFTEGYVFMGFYGFLYNGIIFSFLILLWRNLARSNNILFNAFLIGLFVSQVLNLSRGQSGYFIKDLYMIFTIPVLIYLFGMGIFIKKRRKTI